MSVSYQDLNAYSTLTPGEAYNLAQRAGLNVCQHLPDRTVYLLDAQGKVLSVDAPRPAALAVFEVGWRAYCAAAKGVAPRKAAQKAGYKAACEAIDAAMRAN